MRRPLELTIKISLFLFLCWSMAGAQTVNPLPVTGNISSITGLGTPYAGVYIQLANCPSPVSIAGQSVIAPLEYQIQANGAGLINSTVWPNDKITCNGTTGASQYILSYVANGTSIGTPACYQVVSTQSSWNLNVQQPVTCGQTPPNPQDVTWNNVVANGCLSSQGGPCLVGPYVPLTGAVLSGALTSPSLITASGSVIVDPRSYGAKCDGTTDDTTAIANAVTFINTQPAASIRFQFPAGVCIVNPITQSTTAMLISANGVTVDGSGTTLRVKTQTTPYNQQFAVASGTTRYWWFMQLSGTDDTVQKFRFDSNGQADISGSCAIGGYGCFWVDGVNGLNASQNLKVLDNNFPSLYGWPVLTSGTNTIIRGNFASQTAGMVCENGATNCTIDENISISSIDAPYAVNGASTTNLLVVGFNITNNIAVGTSVTVPNGNGIDVTAATDGNVTGNTIIGQSNVCIQVGKTSGFYTSGAAGTYLPSKRIVVAGNTCKNNNQYGGWPINGEIVVGDYYSAHGGTPFNPGDTADGILISGNSISDYNALSNDYGVVAGYGATNVKVQGNHFHGCGTALTGACAITPYRIFDTGETSNLKYIDNDQDAAYPGVIRTQGSGPYEIAGNGMQTQVASGAPTINPHIVEGTLQVGDNNAFGYFQGTLNLLGGVYGASGYSGIQNFTDANGLLQATLRGSTVNNKLSLQLHTGFTFSIENGPVTADGGYQIAGVQVIPQAANGFQGNGTKVALPLYGSTTLSAGAATVTTGGACSPSATCVYRLDNCGKNASTAIGVLSIASVTAGTSFTINSLSSTATVATGDLSTVCWSVN